MITTNLDQKAKFKNQFEPRNQVQVPNWTKKKTLGINLNLEAKFRYQNVYLPFV